MGVFFAFLYLISSVFFLLSNNTGDACRLFSFSSVNKHSVCVILEFSTCSFSTDLQMTWLDLCKRDKMHLFASQLCQSWRWQSKSPGSRWRRSSASMNTGVSVSPGAPQEPRKAKKRTSGLLVSALSNDYSASPTQCVLRGWLTFKKVGQMVK